MTGIVSVQNLRKTYPGGLHALKGINLEIEEGEILALLGPNGAGTVSYTHLTLPTNREV